jgi:sterol desaturase/sphingolipid hydroxylase (fatty acid hydroxylase superfamily)
VSALDTFVTRIVAPAGAVGFATFAEKRGYGLFHSIAWPAWLELLLVLLVLDLALYLQHRVFHYLPVLWRLHRVHHADLDVDVTTGARFHPIEILLSLGIKFVFILALGASTASVLLFEILLNATSLFNHSNVHMRETVERVIRWLVVTPDMHRTHHSILRRETDSNYGFNFPWWDRIFHTYRAQPEAGHDRMTLGIERFRDVEELRFNRILSQPFRNE